MNFFKLLLTHTLYMCLELFRQPMYLVSTILFPSMFFWFFGIPNAKEPGSIAILSASFACFGVLSVVLFQFGVGISQDKESSWYFYLRSLPSHRGVVLGSRVLAGILFSMLAICGVFATALIFADLKISDIDWLRLFALLFCGAIPFALLGICLGLLVNSQAILPVANLVYLPLSFAGGLWMPPNILPTAIQKISEYLPTRMYGEIIWASVLKREVESKYVYGLIVYGIIFLLTAFFLSKKEEEKSFR